MSEFDEFFDQQMKKPEIAKAYADLQSEYAMIKAGKSENMTQADLAQSDTIQQTGNQKV